MHLYEASSKRRVDGVKDQLVALQGVSTDWALALHGVHADGGAVHEDVPSHLPAADCFQSCGPGGTAQSSRKLCCLFNRPAGADLSTYAPCRVQVFEKGIMLTGEANP